VGLGYRRAISTAKGEQLEHEGAEKTRYGKSSATKKALQTVKSSENKKSSTQNCAGATIEEQESDPADATDKKLLTRGKRRGGQFGVLLEGRHES